MDSSDIEKWRVKLDSYANVEDGVEYWLARDLMEPMGYTRWENFAEVVKRAKVSCETNKTPVDSHFRDTTKMVTAGVAARAVKDYKLTRYACYLIAQNGDSNKPEIALAQAYFAVQTRRQELIEQRFAEIQRLQARHSLSDSEKQLSGIAFKRGVDSKGFAIIKSKGDEALFGGRSTAGNEAAARRTQESGIGGQVSRCPHQSKGPYELDDGLQRRGTRPVRPGPDQARARREQHKRAWQPHRPRNCPREPTACRGYKKARASREDRREETQGGY